jgi:hypothetical protein
MTDRPTDPGGLRAIEKAARAFIKADEDYNAKGVKFSVVRQNSYHRAKDALRAAIVLTPEATAPAPHPGQNHDFDMRCKTCGEPGTLFVAFITPGEKVEVHPHDD